MSSDEVEELKQKLNDEQLAETIEQIIEEKVQQRIEKKENETAINKEKQNISRRKFIKKMGLGAVGFGAAAIMPSASALDVRDSTGLNVYQNGTEYLDVSSTSVNVLNTVLQEQGSRVATRTWVNNNTSSFSGNHSDLTNVNSNDHHSRYTDNEAQNAVQRQSYSYSTSSTSTTWIKVGELYDSGGSFHIRVTDMASYGSSNDDTWMIGKAQAGNGNGEFGGHYYQIGSSNKGGGIEIVDNSTNAEVYVRLGSYAKGTIHITSNNASNISFNSTTTDPGGQELQKVLPVQNNIEMNGNRVLTTADEGSGSGLDADTVDGKEATELSGALRKTQADFSSFIETSDFTNNAIQEPLFLGSMASSSIAMDYIASSSTAMNAIASNSNVIRALAYSPVAMDAIASNSTAVQELQSNWNNVNLSDGQTPSKARIYVAQLEGGGGGGSDVSDGGDGGDSKFGSAVAYGGQGGDRYGSNGSCGGYDNGSTYLISGSNCGGANGGSGAGGGNGGDGGYIKVLVTNYHQDNISATVGSGGNGPYDATNGSDGSASVWVPPWA